jgi:hypothetical protein
MRGQRIYLRHRSERMPSPFEELTAIERRHMLAVGLATARWTTERHLQLVIGLNEW